jgi:hypothetical protein
MVKSASPSPEPIQSLQILHMRMGGEDGHIEWSADLERKPDGQIYLTLSPAPTVYEGEEVETPTPYQVCYASDFFYRLRGEWFEYARGNNISAEQWWQVHEKIRDFAPVFCSNLYDHLRAVIGEPPPKKYEISIKLETQEERTAFWDRKREKANAALRAAGLPLIEGDCVADQEDGPTSV